MQDFKKNKENPPDVIGMFSMAIAQARIDGAEVTVLAMKDERVPEIAAVLSSFYDVKFDGRVFCVLQNIVTPGVELKGDALEKAKNNEVLYISLPNPCESRYTDYFRSIGATG
jgi:hypothetical protein